MTNNGGAIATSIQFSQSSTPNDTIQVTVTKPVQHTFLKFVGLTGTNATATAKVQARVTTGYAFDSVDVFPYAIWGGTRSTPANGCPYNICVGSTQTYRANNYQSASAAIAPDWQVNGNNFKGYFHHGGNVVQINPTTWQTFSSGGNAIGQEPIAALQAHAASGEPIILPVIQQANCSGGCGTITFKIVAWVALQITSVPGNSATPFTGTVVANYSSPLGVSGGTPPPGNFPVIRTLQMAE